MNARCDDSAIVAAFLAAHGLSDAERVPMAGDASTRRYQRLHRPGRSSVILMQAPHPAAELVPFVTMAGLLAGFGLSVPAIIAADAAVGLMLMEDFGDETFAAVLDRGGDAMPLYRLATDTLIALHRACPQPPAGLPVFDALAFETQVGLLAEMAFPEVPEIRSEFETAWQAVSAGAVAGPCSLLLRDYHAGNLMVLADRSGVRGCGLLDFQDGGVGPAAYDLISLVEDARRDVAPELAAAMLEQYLAAFPDLDRRTFRQSCTVLAAIRHTRVIAVFLRLARQGRTGYLHHLPRVWRLLEGHLAAAEMAPVARWFARHLPPERRNQLIISEPK